MQAARTEGERLDKEVRHISQGDRQGNLVAQAIGLQDTGFGIHAANRAHKQQNGTISVRGIDTQADVFAGLIGCLIRHELEGVEAIVRGFCGLTVHGKDIGAFAGMPTGSQGDGHAVLPWGGSHELPVGTPLRIGIEGPGFDSILVWLALVVADTEQGCRAGSLYGFSIGGTGMDRGPHGLTGLVVPAIDMHKHPEGIPCHNNGTAAGNGPAGGIRHFRLDAVAMIPVTQHGLDGRRIQLERHGSIGTESLLDLGNQLGRIGGGGPPPVAGGWAAPAIPAGKPIVGASQPAVSVAIEPIPATNGIKGCMIFGPGNLDLGGAFRDGGTEEVIGTNGHGNGISQQQGLRGRIDRDFEFRFLVFLHPERGLAGYADHLHMVTPELGILFQRQHISKAAPRICLEHFFQHGLAARIPDADGKGFAGMPGGIVGQVVLGVAHPECKLDLIAGSVDRTVGHTEGFGLPVGLLPHHAVCHALEAHVGQPGKPVHIGWCLWIAHCGGDEPPIATVVIAVGRDPNQTVCIGLTGKAFGPDIHPAARGVATPRMVLGLEPEKGYRRIGDGGPRAGIGHEIQRFAIEALFGYDGILDPDQDAAAVAAPHVSCNQIGPRLGQGRRDF